ncbi:MAG: DNA repair protein RadA [Oligoflexia bacterium]|nr:DNA repair protein RadA [Oligoflexia bacterium]
MKTKKLKTLFFCSECGASSPKWQGQCSNCGKWNCLIEEPSSPSFSPFKTVKQKPTMLSQQFPKSTTRVPTGIKELDRVLGGGLVSGSYILLGGAPGIGKSTLFLQMAQGLSRQKLKVFYVSAEESLEQTSLRAERLNLKNQDNIFISNETSLEKIFHHIESIKPNVLIVDSIQTVQMSDTSSAPGTISQVRECAGQFMSFAKNTNTAVFLIGHITKDGQLGGPRLLEHMVDTVLSFDGDPHYPFRLLRALKNRFGAINEIGVFQMSAEGLKEVSNPSEFFLEERKEDLIGSVVFTAIEGSRPLLCEIQALCLRSYLSVPRRTTIGLDTNRLHKISAVLDRYLKIGLSQCDMFLNLPGGLKITEPGVDLPIAKALISSKKQEPVDKLSCFFGEIDLTGKIRTCTFTEDRIKEAHRLGFKNIYLPEGSKKHLIKNTITEKLNLHWLQSIKDLL